MTRRSLAPAILAALINGRSRRLSTWARITRAVVRHSRHEIVRMMFDSDGRSKATSTTANGRKGIPKTTSVIRISRLSIQPPK